MILLPAQYRDNEIQIYKEPRAKSIAKHLQEAFSLTKSGKGKKEGEDYLFVGNGGWMDPGELLYIYDSLRAFRQ